MTTVSMIDDLYRFNNWANGRVLGLCNGLTDEQLDQPRDMGFGSLRATIFHILAAEEIWLERWAGSPWRPFPFEPDGLSVNLIAERLNRVSERRKELIEQERASHWGRQVTYLDSKRVEGTRRLNDLLVHVANHSVHHRAQALHYLKQFGRTVPVGLDYLLYKLAYPTFKQDVEVVTNMRNYGLEVESGVGSQIDYQADDIQDYFAYHDWASETLLNAASALDEQALDRDFGMGPGSLRKTFQHLADVEPFWMKNWGVPLTMPQPSTVDGFIPKLKETSADIAAQRNAFIAQLDETKASQMVLVAFGGPPMRFRVVESLIQICEHGTHHRAQISNMLRQSGIQPPATDYSKWIHDRAVNAG
jgi:uncharacterized damage-inducible protein DinB